MASKTKTESIYLLVKDFPLLSRYRELFDINEDEVAFPYDGKIYSNKELSPELLAHETVHFQQQKDIGLDEWQEQYLTNPSFRVKMEIEAYKKQLTFYTANKDVYDIGRTQMAKVLSSPMYGNVITYKEAYGLLK